jgi:hypothetical protein
MRFRTTDIATLRASAITGTGNAQAIRINLGRLALFAEARS